MYAVLVLMMLMGLIVDVMPWLTGCWFGCFCLFSGLIVWFVCWYCLVC